MKASLIVSIVRKGWGSSVLQASVKAGARGGTVLYGRGAGIHEQEKIFGMSIEPEKEIVLTLVYAEQVDTILEEIVRTAELNDTGRGIAFVLPVDRIAGVAHFMKAAAGQVSAG
jgi:nitrogen regulatory protein P-II 1